MKKSVIIALSLVTLLVLASVIFGIVFFTVSIGVSNQVEQVFSDYESVTLRDNSTGDSIPLNATSVKNLILDEIEDLKFTNAIIKRPNSGGETVFKIGSSSIIFYGNAIKINGKWYASSGNDDLSNHILLRTRELLTIK